MARKQRKTIPEALLEAMPYIINFRDSIFVIKYGGAAMKSDALKHSFAQEVVLLQMLGVRVVLVHGGGDDISETMQARKIEVEKISGKRVTNNVALEVVRERLGGVINQDIVNLLRGHGGQVIGLNGVTFDLIRVAPCQNVQELEHVGDIESINTGNLLYQLNKYMPVIAPIGIDAGRNIYNVNADDAAGEVATALNAAKLIYLSNVDGVLDNKQNTIKKLPETLANKMILDKDICSGMIPKVLSGFKALKKGVSAVQLINGSMEHSLLLELFTDKGVGTQLVLG